MRENVEAGHSVLPTSWNLVCWKVGMMESLLESQTAENLAGHWVVRSGVLSVEHLASRMVDCLVSLMVDLKVGISCLLTK